jgi:L-threonylcarbamoyladenylate synthase
MAFLTNDLEIAKAALLNAKPVALPTETVYGLAAIADDEKAVRAVFSMKGRPLNHPLIVHVADFDTIRDRLQHVPAYVERFREAFWPGPLTFVLSAQKNAFSPLVTAGQDSVAIRCPNHPLTLDLLRAIAKPIVAPSANPFGKVSPTTAEHVMQSFAEEALLVLEGGRCQVGIESTIIDATCDEGFRILRHGLISASELSKIDNHLLNDKNANIRVSGALKTHYQPQKPLYYFNNQQDLEKFCQSENKLFVIARSKPRSAAVKQYAPLPDTASSAAYELYYLLRAADDSEAEMILIEMPAATEEWAGVRERIEKAGKAIS